MLVYELQNNHYAHHLDKGIPTIPKMRWKAPQFGSIKPKQKKTYLNFFILNSHLNLSYSYGTLI